MRVSDVPRNDLEAAQAFYKAKGALSGAEIRSLYMLQDDPAEFVKLCKGWKTTRPLRR